MKVTDERVLKELRRVRSCDLDEYVLTYPEDEKDGRSDMQILADECSYILSCYEEEGHAFCEDLQSAKAMLRKTKNGKVIPLWMNTLKPIYSKSQIESARATVNEHKRLQSLMKRLNANGFYGRW